MRFKYYKRIIGQMRHKKLIALIVFCGAICTYLIIYIKQEIIPTIETICESRAQAIALTVTTQTIENHMKDVEYDDLMQIKYNETGKVSTISANVNQMNKLTAQIVNEVQNKLSEVEETTVKIPIGKLLGWSIFSGYGPKLNIKLVPTGNVTANFKTEFGAQGINQTKHTVLIEINTAITIVAPFTIEDVNSRSVLTVAETVIIGEIPETYLQLREDQVEFEY